MRDRADTGMRNPFDPGHLHHKMFSRDRDDIYTKAKIGITNTNSLKDSISLTAQDLLTLIGFKDQSPNALAESIHRRNNLQTNRQNRKKLTRTSRQMNYPV
jgi:hypothetical protein